MFKKEVIRERRQRLAISCYQLSRDIYNHSMGTVNIGQRAIGSMETDGSHKVSGDAFYWILKILELDPREVFGCEQG